MGGLPRLAWSDLPDLFPAFAGAGRWLPLLERHAALIEAAAGRVRVTSVPREEVVARHYAESLEALRIVLAAMPAPPALVSDVGSGGGFPGAVVAAVLPETVVHLVEPLKKRARLLEELTAELGLANVTVHPLRAEEAGRGPLRDATDLVVARAVAALPVLVEYLAPLARSVGTVAAIKGSGAQTEVTEAAAALDALGCANPRIAPMRPAVSETMRVVLLDKLGATPERFPRRPGIPEKRPLT